MKSRTLNFVAACLLGLAPTLASAAETAQFYYVDPAQIDLDHILAPPPAIGSSSGKADIDGVLAAQKVRTRADARAAEADSVISLLIFAGVMGPGFTEDKLNFAIPFFQHATSDGFAAISVVKRHYNRTRPFAADKRVKPAFEVPPTDSYPSGHATFAYIDGILLADMVPEKAATIFDRAAEYAHHRVVAGVHYPTDVEAGRISGSVTDNVLLHDAKFMADFEKAKVEVRHAAGLQ